MAKGSFDWQAPDLKEKVKEGTVRNHPTNPKLKQKYTGGKWVSISVKRFTSKGGGAPNQGTADDKAKRIDKINRADPNNTQYFFRGKKVSKAKYDSIKGSQSRFKSTKYVAPKPTPKDKGGKVTYRHRDTSGKTGIEVSGNTVVSKPGDKDAIRNNVKADKGKQSTITKKEEKPEGTNQELDPREAKAQKLEKRIERFKDTPLMKRGGHRRNLERQIRNLRKKKKDDDKNNRTGSSYVGSIHQA
jgi:hypothetical protein